MMNQEVSHVDNVITRTAQARDLTGIHAIERSVFADPWSLEGFREALHQPSASVLVAVNPDDQVLGYAVAWCVSDEAEVANLAVAPESQGRHIGAALLDRVLQGAELVGSRSVFLEVRETNVAALGLYLSRGFTEVGRRHAYYRRPVEDALIMRKSLPG